MSALASDIAIDNPADNLKGPLWLSVLMHAALAGFLIYSGIHSHTGDLWGGAGGAITVGLVGNVPGIPMPRPRWKRRTASWTNRRDFIRPSRRRK